MPLNVKRALKTSGAIKWLRFLNKSDAMAVLVL